MEHCHVENVSSLQQFIACIEEKCQVWNDGDFKVKETPGPFTLISRSLGNSAAKYLSYPTKPAKEALLPHVTVFYQSNIAKLLQD